MTITTTSNIEGHRITQYLGVCRGSTTSLFSVEQARDSAFREMLKDGKAMGANAIVGVRYDSASIGSSAQIFCYGTAVVIEKD